MNTYICQKIERLDSFLSRESGISRSKIKKLIENKEDSFVKINGQTAHNAAQKLFEGQEVSLIVPEYTSQLQAEYADIPILYKDEHIAIVDKPAGLIVHPGPSCKEQTLAHYLLGLFPELQSVEGLRPGIVHRLDKETSGLMIIALTEEARLNLAEDFAERSVEKTYLALCQGAIPMSGECLEPLGRHPTNKVKRAVVPVSNGGKEAHTEWQVLYPKTAHTRLANAQVKIPQTATHRSNTLQGNITHKKASYVDVAAEMQNISLVEIQIHTGRTHQIRVHMDHMGYTLLGDKVYGDHSNRAKRHMLHAWKIAFQHPITDEALSFCSTPPEDFMEILFNNLKKEQHKNKLIITGNAGSGKSLAASILQEKGCAFFSADECIAQLYQPGADGWTLLRGHYGFQFTPDDDKPVDKVNLALAMQHDILRKEINAMLHPLVFAHLKDFFHEHEADTLCIAEIPLWHEIQQNQPITGKVTGKNNAEVSKSTNPKDLNFNDINLLNSSINDKNIMTLSICSDQETRHARLTQRGWSMDNIAHTDAWQWSQEDKAQASDYAIENNGDRTDLHKKIDTLLVQIEKEENARVLSIYTKIEDYLNKAKNN